MPADRATPCAFSAASSSPTKPLPQSGNTHITGIRHARRVVDVLGDEWVEDIDELVIGLVAVEDLTVEDVRFAAVSLVYDDR